MPSGPPQEINADLPAGLGGMSVPPTLHSDPRTLRQASNVTFVDDTLRKTPGAAVYDAVGLASIPAFFGTLNNTTDGWVGVVAALKGDGSATPSFVQQIGTVFASTKTNFTTLTVPVAGVTAGNTIVVVVSEDPRTDLLAGPPVHCAVSDTAGNAYTFVAGSGSGHGFKVSLFVAQNVLPLTSGWTIIVGTPGQQNTYLHANACEYTHVKHVNPVDQTAMGGGGSTAVSIGPTPGVSQLPILLVAGVMNRYAPVSTLTPTNTFVQRSTSSNSAVGSATAASQSFQMSRADTMSPSIIALHDYWPESTASAPGGGTVTTVLGSITVTGAGTAFATTNGSTGEPNVTPGDRIIVAGEMRTVAAVGGANTLVTTEPWHSAAAGAAWTIRYGQRLITAATDGAIYKDNLVTTTDPQTGDLDAVTLASGLSVTARPGRFVYGGYELTGNPRKLFYYNGVNIPQVLTGNGATTTGIAGGASSWSANNYPTNAVIHLGRNCAFGVANDPHRLFISRFDNHETFTVTDPDTAQLGVRSNWGDRLWAGAEFNGILWLGKFPRGIFYLDDSDPLVKNWIIREKSEALGVIPSPYGFLPLDDDVMLMSPDGHFHLLSAVTSLGGVLDSDLSRRMWIHRYLQQHLNLARLSQVTSAWYSQLKIALWGVPWDGSMGNTRLLAFDFGLVQSGGPVRFQEWPLYSPDAMAMRRGFDQVERPIVGEAGFVYLSEQATRSKGTMGYQSTYQLPTLDMSHLVPWGKAYRKNWIELEMAFEPVQQGSLSVQVQVDGTNRGAPIAFDPTIHYQNKLIQVGDGRFISAVVTDGGNPGDDFEVLSHTIGFTQGNRDQSRGTP